LLNVFLACGYICNASDLTPHIFLYLQNYPVSQLKLHKTHIYNQYNIEFDIGKRQDGYGAILRFTSVEKTFQFLNYISPCTQNCESMKYKVDWDWRFEVEKEKYLRDYPTYEVLTSRSFRSKAYTQEEIETILTLKNQN